MIEGYTGKIIMFVSVIVFFCTTLTSIRYLQININKYF